MQKLAAKVGCTELRFWGKIHGTERDYYIAEGKAEVQDEEGQDQLPADAEQKGSGVNENIYWACNSPIDNQWSKLPDLVPGDIAIARQIKFSFSGDLHRRIITNPFFHKSESYLLRA